MLRNVRANDSLGQTGFGHVVDVVIAAVAVAAQL